MSIYKITNITNLAGKRDFKYNSTLDVEYVDNMIKKVVKIKPGDNLFLTASTLPLSVHKLRIQNLVTVIEINGEELAKTVNALKKVTAKKPEMVIQSEVEDYSKKSYKKKGIKPDYSDKVTD
jgi:hypothetical protein